MRTQTQEEGFAMNDPRSRLHAAFRLNLEQQKKRAKELLKAARTRDEQALHRLRNAALPRKSESEFQLADAQFTIARELGFSSWPELKAHIEQMQRARAASRTGA
jgi:hypothetical protein